jgi:hypothetical protein
MFILHSLMVSLLMILLIIVTLQGALFILVLLNLTFRILYIF